MTASLQIKKGNYYVVLSYKDKSGKNKTKWVATGLPERNNKRRAEAMVHEVIHEYAYLEKLEVTQETTFKEYAQEWLDNKKKAMEFSTYERYENQVLKQIEPFFGKYKLADITPRLVSEYYQSKVAGGRLDGREGGLAHRTMKSHAALIRSILRQAVIEGVLMRNPAEYVPLPTRGDSQEKNIVFLSAAEANKMLEAFEGHQLRELVYVALYYGLRRSEVLGLKWSVVNFESNIISINHTVVKYSSVVAKDRTKSAASNSSYDLIPAVKDVLLKLKERQAEDKKLFGNCYVESDYIFKWQDGSLIRPDVLTRSFQRVLKNHGLQHMRFHDLRHSTASMLFDLGWDIKAIQVWLRHADIETTGNIYTHISNERKKIMANELDDLLTF